MHHIHISEAAGKSAVCFDTGLEPRSFARTKMSQCLIEPGYIVYPDGSNKVWKASGVDEIEGLMRVWGPSFGGERLDFFLDEIDSAENDAPRQEAAQQAALQAVVFWIRAKMLFGETSSTLNPGAAFVCCADKNNPEPKGSVFFAPENLAQRCLLVEGLELNHYSCPDLKGMEAAAFCAGAMLYKILIKAYPYPTAATIYQDMREGVFLPPLLAVSGLDKKLCGLIQSALLLPVENKKTHESGTDILGNFLQILMDKEGAIAGVSSLFHPLPAEEEEQAAKERKFFLLKQKIFVNTKRFVARNKPGLAGAAIALLFVVFITVSMTINRGNRPTTAGMASDTVIYAYYEAFSSLNHVFMEACLLGADKSDVNVAVNYFAVSRVRQANEMTVRPSIIPARLWRENGGELPAPDVFGVTDLSLELLGGDEDGGIVVYRADYLLWFPNENFPSRRSDEITLTRRRGNWRITDINRTLN